MYTVSGAHDLEMDISTLIFYSDIIVTIAQLMRFGLCYGPSMAANNYLEKKQQTYN